MGESTNTIARDEQGDQVTRALIQRRGRGLDATVDPTRVAVGCC